MATEQELAQALGPAFGIYPKAFRGNTGNPQDAANLPVDVMRGRTAGLLGMFGDVVNQPSAFTPVRAVQLAMQGVMGQDKYPDTEHFLKTLPLKPTSRAGEVAGQAASFVPLNPAPAVRAAKAGVQALGPTASNMVEDFLMRRGLMPTLDVYHGTPHTLPPTERNPLGEFDASKIGTGEGAQAFGHGIYTAENPSIGRYYQNALGKYIDRIKIGDTELPVSEAIAKYADNGEGSAKALQRMKEKGRLTIDQYNDMIRDEIIPEIRTNLNLPKEKWETVEGLSGNLYKADLPDEMIPKMLDWDKPLSKQKPVMLAIRTEAEQRVRNQLLGDIENNIRASLPKTEIGNDYMAMFSNENVAQNQTVKNQALAKLNKMDLSSLIEKEMQSMKPVDATWEMTGKDFYEMLSKQTGSAKQAAEMLRNQGVPGIKYLDEASRAKGEGTRNFVTFPGEEKNLTILERNAEKSAK